MDEKETRKGITGVYEELKGLLESLKDSTAWFYDHGFSHRTNVIIDRIPSVCPEIQDVSSYKISLDLSNPHGGGVVHTTQAKAQLSSIIGRLKGTYGLDSAEKNPGNTFIQNQLQSQFQSLSVALEFQEKIISEISKHAAGTKERGFLEKLKSALPTIKSITDILSLALKLGADFGLDPATINKLLGL